MADIFSIENDEPMEEIDEFELNSLSSGDANNLAPAENEQREYNASEINYDSDWSELQDLDGPEIKPRVARDSFFLKMLYRELQSKWGSLSLALFVRFKQTKLY